MGRAKAAVLPEPAHQPAETMLERRCTAVCIAWLVTRCGQGVDLKELRHQSSTKASTPVIALPLMSLPIRATGMQAACSTTGQRQAACEHSRGNCA